MHIETGAVFWCWCLEKVWQVPCAVVSVSWRPSSDALVEAATHDEIPKPQPVRGTGFFLVHLLWDLL